MAVPAEDVTSSRSIGEILLSRSLVSEEELEHAIAVQRDTGKPLGQILVEAGTITRLELASALAEQWGDVGTISPTFPGGSAYVDPTEPEDARRAARPLGLVVDGPAGDPAWQQEITSGLRALFNRVDVLEAAQGQLADRHEAAFSDELRNAVVELAQRVAAVTPELDALRDRVEGTASVAAVQHGLSEIASRIDELAPQLERTQGQVDDAGERVEEVAAGLASAIDELRRAVGAITAVQEELATRIEGTARLETVGSLHTAIEELRAGLTEIARQPAGDPALAARVEALAVDIASRADAEAVGALGAAVEELARRAAADASVAPRVDELAAKVDELAERLELGAAAPAGDGEPDPRVDALIARVAELAARPHVDPTIEDRLEETGARLEALARELAARPAGDAAAENRVVERLQRVEAVAAELAARPSLDGRLDELAHHVDAVAAELAGRADAAGQAELARLVADLAERPSADPKLAEHLEALAAEVRVIAERPAGDPALGERLEQLGAGVAELAARVEAVAAQASVQPVPGPEPDPRVEELLTQVAELATRVEALPAQAAAAGVALPDDLDARLAAASETASRRVAAELTSAMADGRRELDARLEWLAARVEAVASAPQPAPAPAPAAKGKDGERQAASAADGDVERLRMAVERLMLDFAEHRRALSAALPSRDLEERVRRLTDQMAELNGLVLSVEPSGNGGPAGGGGGSIDRELASQVRQLVNRMEEVEASSAAGRETMLARLERMMGTIDWRLQRLESNGE